MFKVIEGWEEVGNQVRALKADQSFCRGGEGGGELTGGGEK